MLITHEQPKYERVLISVRSIQSTGFLTDMQEQPVTSESSTNIPFHLECWILKKLADATQMQDIISTFQDLTWVM